MVETKRAVTDPSLLLDNLIAKRHDPAAPSPQAVADAAENRRRAQRQRETREHNRRAWIYHYRRVADSLRDHAAELEQRAVALERGT